MLVDGPTEWAETFIPVGNKLDLLQHAYNPVLGIAALPKETTVVLVCYGSENSTIATGDEVIETVTDEIVLHSEQHTVDESKPDAFRFVSWFNSNSEHFVAIATVERVEVWRVSVEKSLQAVFIGSFKKHPIRGIRWHSVHGLLLAYTGTTMDLITVTPDRHLHVESLLEQADAGRDHTMQCAWSPCGLMLARSTDSAIHFYSWPNSTDIGTSKPSVSSYRVATPSSAALLGSEPKYGAITACAVLSPSVCVVVTDTPLALADFNSSESSENATLKSKSPTILSSSSSNVIDLTSLRITATSSSSLLNILDRPKPSLPVPKRNSHLSIVAKNPMGQWHRYAQVTLDQLAIPDVLDVEAMRVVVGSTISNRIVVIHLDHKLKSGWSASVSGELQLPEGHVCRGLRLAKTSPFVQVASTEKIKRTFFHATSGPQRILLSKFKVPRRRRGPSPQQETTPSIPVPVAVSPQASPSSNPDLLTTLLSRIEALQTLMISRFDHVEKRLEDVSSRLARLELLDKPSL